MKAAETYLSSLHNPVSSKAQSIQRPPWSFSPAPNLGHFGSNSTSTATKVTLSLSCTQLQNIMERHGQIIFKI